MSGTLAQSCLGALVVLGALAALVVLGALIVLGALAVLGASFLAEPSIMVFESKPAFTVHGQVDAIVELRRSCQHFAQEVTNTVRPSCIWMSNAAGAY